MAENKNYIRTIIITLSIIMLLSILPAFLLSFWTYPTPGDDYMFAIPLQEGIEEGGLIAPISALINYISDLYMNWQGSFISCLIFALSPIFISPSLYGVVMFLFNIIFALSIFFFCNTFLTKYYDLKKYISFFVASLILFSFYHCMPYIDLYEFCYWYTGSSFYQLTLSCYFLFVSLLYRLNEKSTRAEKTAKTMVILSLLAIFLGQNNIPAAILTWSGYVILISVAYLYKHPLRKKLLIIFGFLTAALLVNALAPGYVFRYNHGISQNMVVIEETNIFEVLLLSFKVGTISIRKFAFITPLIGVLILITPILYRHFIKSKNKYINPLFLLVATYLIFISQYAPFLFSLGQEIEYGRVIAYRFTLSLVLYVINYINLISFTASKIQYKSKTITTIILIICLLLGSYLTYHSFKVRIIPKSHIRVMFQQYQSGRIETYLKERDERNAILNDDSVKVVEFEPLTYKTVCFSFDFTAEERTLVNIHLEQYYNKDSIIVKSKE